MAQNELRYAQVARIKVFGIGGAGCNAVNRMVEDGVQGVEFYVCNTDLQVLNTSPVKNKIILGRETTKGLGAGANPEVGYKAAQESEAEIREAMKDCDMIFLTAGMGGGTGTGASPFFAQIAKEVGALTVGIVTKPFSFEGKKRAQSAEAGLEKLREFVDSLIIVSNNRVLEVIGRIPFADAFREADNVLRQGVQTITDLIAVPNLINLDFADVKAIMSGQGTALIGIGMAQGDNKAQEAAQKAIQSPLLEADIKGAKNAIVNVTGGASITIMDASDAVEFIRDAAGDDIDVVFGVAINEALGESIIVTVVATGFEAVKSVPKAKPVEKTYTQTVVTNVEPVAAVRAPKTEDIEETGSDIPSFLRNRF